MKRFLLGAAVYITAMAAQAEEAPLWMRYCVISPDGGQIAFTYKGDIYTVDTGGGKARQITSSRGYDTHPVWSPDGKSIAFASDREGSMDVFIVGRDGGVPRRLTSHSGNEVPVAFRDNDHVLFGAAVMPDAEDMTFPSAQFPQVYEVSTEGGRPVMFSSVPMEDISISPDGRSFLYHDRKGYEDAWRKHHTSSITRDIWLCTVAVGRERRFRKITTFDGEDRTPVWAQDGKSFYYLSERDGSFNIYRSDIEGRNITRLTSHTGHPVRFLSAAKDGTLCYGFNGEIYTLKEGEPAKKVAVSIVADTYDRHLVKQLKSSGATEISVSPEGKEVAFVMRGDVYVTSVEYKTTKQITDTPEQERDIDFSPDGRSIVYASERDGLWQIYQTSLVDKDDKLFTYANDFKEERLVNSSYTSFQPQYSPDGKEVAFLQNRTELRVLNLKTKAVRTVMDGKFEYSYSDGDQWFEWSPDSRWLLSGYIGHGGWNNKDVALVNASGNGEIHNLTQSGYTDGDAKWVLGGKAMIWKSDRAGYRSHGSWGSEDDVYIMFFDLDAYEHFRMSKEETALLEEAEKKEKEEDAKKEDEKKKGKRNTDEKEKKDVVEPLEFDLENCRDRIVRLTVNSSRLGDAVLSAKGDKLYYQAAFEDGYDLWVHDLKENKTSIVMKNIGYGAMMTDKKQENLYICNSSIKKVNMEKGESKNVEFNALFNYRPYEERQYMFDHIWKQVEDKFYVADLHGVDWKGYYNSYRRFLPHINNNYDFQEMLSEMLGELNGSHTGARYYAPGASFQTACLGAFYDNEYTGDGLKIKEIIAKGPFAVKKTDVTEGCIIEKIDGEKIQTGMDYYPLLEGKAGKKVLLSVYNPETKKRFDVTVKAISAGEQSDLLYRRWVRRNEQLVEKLSGGRVAYVHVQGMNSPSFRTVYSELLSEKNRTKEAVIVDTRHNGGGWLHDDLVTLLNGKEYQRFVPRGQYIGSDPFNKWLKPSCVLVCEDNYSNAHGFPWVYKELGIGKLIGTPVPGTMTAVWWERQIDPSIVFGIPQVGCMDMRGEYLENKELQPDIEVYNSPEEMLRGEDRQLEAAVKEMLKTIEEY
ncbi:S41 family peptidase [uncultured Bacteroides sp.]|uniref:S41 family peptidase n=1 Tax=uncultured Bacteroides sp. TaxID=162156 RepID=UPI0027D96AF5|nr:S41 family peptidase [uncultured Bacteroides sp.]